MGRVEQSLVRSGKAFGQGSRSVPHPQVGEATALVQVGEVAGEVHGVRLVDVDVRSGARRRGRCACAGLLCGVVHFF